MSKKAQEKTETFFDRAENLKAESQALSEAIPEHVERQGSIKAEVRKTNSEISALRHRAEIGSANFESEICDCEERLASLQEEQVQVEQAIRDSSDRLSEVALELETLGLEVTRSDVLTFLESLQEAEEHVARLQGLLDEQAAIQQEAGEIDSRLPELEQQKEDLLATQAAGDSTEGDLDGINAQIAKEETRVAKATAEAEAKVATAVQTSKGLSRKLEEATARHALLLERREQIILACLRSEATQAGKQYIKHAKALISNFKRMAALDILCRHRMPELRGRPVVLGHQWQEMQLPSVRLKEAEEEMDIRAEPLLFCASKASRDFTKLAETIEQELADVGIVL